MARPPGRKAECRLASTRPTASRCCRPGPTPHTPLAQWTFSIRQDGRELKSWSWDEIQALPAETVTADIHCVTRWSKLDTQWRGVSMDTLLKRGRA